MEDAGQNGSAEKHPAQSKRKGLRNPLNIVLLLVLIALLVVFGFVLGFITIPGFRHHNNDNNHSNDTGVSVDSAHYAVIKENFPDPTIVNAALVGGWSTIPTNSHDEWWAFATRNDRVNVQVASAANLADWTYHDGWDALPDPGPWVSIHNNQNDSQVWAPVVTNRVCLHPR
jgi:hypothetical protein